MTNDTAAASADYQGVLDGIIAQLATVSIENPRLSESPQKCEHYCHLGTVNETAVRLMLVGDQELRELKAMRAAVQHEADEIGDAAEAQLASMDIGAQEQFTADTRAKIDLVVNQYNLAASAKGRRLQIISTLLQLEIEQQYPDVIGKEKVILNEDCSIGYVDHTNVARERLRESGYTEIGTLGGLGMLFARSGSHGGAPVN